ncbi:MAG: aminoglycoside 3'-phosphotransferase [Ruminococcaceae bacterium]|nr:aminoglycoside 3'-phosphotransferase [Oscillospiraceae bacterium]
MKRTKIEIDLACFPEELHEYLRSSDVYDSSSSPEARVIFIDRDGGYYLKRSAQGALQKEALLTAYFHSKKLSSEVLSYLSLDADWLLTRRVTGEDCTYAGYLADPKRLAVLLGERLRMLHDTGHADCPVKDRMDAYFALARENYRAGNFDLSYARGFGISNQDEAWRCAERNLPYLKNDTLLHGDYCLPNVMLDDWRFSGFVDLGNGGVGDRHVDLFWGAWTLCYNLKTDRYRELFFEAYGKERIEQEALRTVAAAEVFG